MQGACTGEVPADLLSQVRGVDLIPLQPGQCLILSDDRLFAISAGLDQRQVHVAMDNLYLRMQRAGSSDSDELMITNGPAASTVEHDKDGLLAVSGILGEAAASVWLTNMTLQGDGAGPGRALALREDASVHISGEACS